MAERSRSLQLYIAISCVMTKYVISGGALNGDLSSEHAVFEEIIKGFEKAPTLLVCYFAQPRGHWERRFELYQEKCTEVFPQNIISILPQ